MKTAAEWADLLIESRPKILSGQKREVFLEALTFIIEKIQEDAAPTLTAERDALAARVRSLNEALVKARVWMACISGPDTKANRDYRDDKAFVDCVLGNEEELAALTPRTDGDGGAGK